MLAGAHDPAIATNRPRPRPTATALLRPRPGHGTAAAAQNFSLYKLIGPPPKLWGVLWLQTWPNNYASRIRSTFIEQDPFHMYGTETRSIRMERTLFHTVWNGGRSIPMFQDAAIYIYIYIYVPFVFVRGQRGQVQHRSNAVYGQGPNMRPPPDWVGLMGGF